MATLLIVIAAMVFFPWLILKITRLEKWVPLPVAQIAFGICFGPSALGMYWPELWTDIFTQPVRVGLDAIQLLAITIFAFIAGVELKPKEIIAREGSKIWTQAIQVIIVPIILASIAFLVFFDSNVWHSPDVPFWKYAWAMGVATCITAIPMLVVSCKSLGIWGSHTSKKLLGIVTFDDLILWITVALIISIGEFLVNSAIFFTVLAILFVVWPKILDRLGEDSWPSMIVSLVLLMAFFSHWAGLHYIFGAFFAGMITPRKAVKWNEGMDYQQMFWLMPVFFIWAGLKTQWTINLELIFLAAIGMYFISLITKFIGVWLAYKQEGMRVVCFKTAMLQNKGLMEIVLVTMLLTANVISVNMFAAVVIMSLISTVSAVPLARLFFDKKMEQ